MEYLDDEHIDDEEREPCCDDLDNQPTMNLYFRLIKDLLTSFAMKRRLSYAQLNDLVRRAMADKVFDLSASNDEFANPFLDEVETTYWLESLERSGKAAHVFATDASDAVKPEETYGGYTAEQLAKMPPQDRLAIANRVEAERAKYQ